MDIVLLIYNTKLDTLLELLPQTILYRVSTHRPGSVPADPGMVTVSYMFSTQTRPPSGTVWQDCRSLGVVVSGVNVKHASPMSRDEACNPHAAAHHMNLDPQNHWVAKEHACPWGRFQQFSSWFPNSADSWMFNPSTGAAQ